MPVPSPRLRKAVLSVHLTASVGWIGAAMAYLALGLWATGTSDPDDVAAAWAAMEVTGWYVIVPLALAALSSGIALALVTRWGLFRHYWVVISLGATTFSTVILLLHMPTVTATAEAARRLEGERLRALGGDLLHPAAGLLLLVLIQALNVFKPPGVTRYGWRKQQEERSARTATGA